MNAKATRRLLLAVAMSGAVLSGCVPAGTTGTATGGCDPSGMAGINGCDSTADPVSDTSDTGSGEVSCDPNGFGPLSGCDGDQRGDRHDNGAVPDDGVTAEDMAVSARHEAWHVAAARCNGWHVVSSEIYPDGGGLTTVDMPVGAPLRQQLTLLVAGAVADETDEWSLDDLLQAGQAMHDADVHPSDRDRLVDDARADAARCAATQGAQIERDTADLLEDGEL